MKKFTTIFPFASNVHLTKDIGQVANSMAKFGAFQSTLVCYQLEHEYSFLKTEANHLKIDFIEPQGLILFLEKAVLSYIKRNAKNIDVLHFFKMTKETIYYALYYKRLNPSGRIYIKLDIVNREAVEGFRYSKKKWFNQVHKLMEAQLMKKVHTLSVENPEALELLQRRYPKYAHKICLITNGVNSQFLNENFSCINTFDEKENIILAVGRIGAVDKDFELLLESFAASDLGDWKLMFVGPIENGFDEKVAQVISKNPSLESQIELVGSIENRKSLYQYFNRSKVCCLSSPSESFGLVYIESMYFGNYIVGTKEMSAFSFISNDYSLGTSFASGSKKQLIQVLKRITANEELLRNVYPKAIQRTKDKFSWSKIMPRLIDRLAN